MSSADISPADLRLKKRPPPPPPSKKPPSLRAASSSPSLSSSVAAARLQYENRTTPAIPETPAAIGHAPQSTVISSSVARSHGAVPPPPPPRSNVAGSPLAKGSNVDGDAPLPPLPRRPSASPARTIPNTVATPPPLPARNRDQARPSQTYNGRSETPPRPPGSPSPAIPFRSSSTGNSASLARPATSTGSARRLKAPPWDGQSIAGAQHKQLNDGRRVSSKNSMDRVSSLATAPPLPSRQNSMTSSPSRSPVPPIREMRAQAVPPTPPLSTASTSPSLPVQTKPPILPRQAPRPPSSSPSPATTATPPPVPLSTRPDPIDTPLSVPARPPVSSNPTSNCMTCRDFSAPDTHATRYPRETLLHHMDLRWLAIQLTSPFPSATDKARVIFTWLHHNIAYDTVSFFSGGVRGTSVQDTIVKGAAVCDDYAGLFEVLATYSGLEARKITGHGKGFGHIPLGGGAQVPAPQGNHAWNAVRVDGGEWKLVDTCWGAGNVKQDQTYEKMFKPGFFTMTATEFALTHFPLKNGLPVADNADFYFPPNRRPPSWEEYMRTDPDCPDGIKRPIFYGALEREHGIGSSTMRPLNGDIPVQTQPGPLRFEFSLKCPHWTVEEHSNRPDGPCLFLLCFQRRDGSAARLPFHHVRTNADGAADFWFLDIEDPKTLGHPGQSVMLNALNTLGDRHSSRGMTAAEYHDRAGRVGCSFSGVAQWKLV